MNTAEKIYTTETDGYLKTIQHHIYFRDAEGLYHFMADPALKASMAPSAWAEFINMPINNDGDTMLIWSCYRSYDALFQFLMAEPAIDMLKTDFHGFDAMTVAQHAKRADLAAQIKDTLETMQQSVPPAPFEFEERQDVVTTPSSTIKQWLYGGKISSNQNNPSFSAQRLSSRK